MGTRLRVTYWSVGDSKSAISPGNQPQAGCWMTHENCIPGLPSPTALGSTKSLLSASRGFVLCGDSVGVCILHVDRSPSHCTALTGFIKVCPAVFRELQPYSLSSFLNPLPLLTPPLLPSRASSTFMPRDHTPPPESASTPQTFPSIGHCLPLPSLPSEFG